MVTLDINKITHSVFKRKEMDPFRLCEEYYREHLKPHPEMVVLILKNHISVYFSVRYYLAVK